MKKVFWKYLSWLLLLAWMLVIFYLSHQPSDASKALSTDLGEPIRHILNMIGINIGQENFQFWIRKMAHFSAYALLGIFSFYAMKFSIDKFHFISAMTICVLYAISDEVHQLFIPGRSGEVRDVLIDSSGAFCGILLSSLAWLLFTKIQKKTIK